MLSPTTSIHPFITSSDIFPPPPSKFGLVTMTKADPIVVVAFLDCGAGSSGSSHRLAVRDKLLSSERSHSRLEAVAQKTRAMVLPQDDVLLRAFLAYEIVENGETPTLIKWALKFTASTHEFVVLSLNPNDTAQDEDGVDVWQLVKSVVTEAEEEGGGGMCMCLRTRRWARCSSSCCLVVMVTNTTRAMRGGRWMEGQRRRMRPQRQGLR